MMRTDEQIKRDAEDQLLWSARVDSSKVQVDVSNGAVVLSGEVPTYIEWEAALDAAWSVPGVANVENRLDVRQRPDEKALTDEEVQERVSSVLAWNPNLDKSGIHATVREGVVILEGTVDAHWKRLYIEDLVGSIVGVLWIRNHLAVVPTHGVLDRVIAEQVIATLEQDAQVDAEDVEVTTERGIVTLSGLVPSWDARKSAEKDASVTPGVSAVRNNLGIKVAA